MSNDIQQKIVLSGVLGTAIARLLRPHDASAPAGRRVHYQRRRPEDTVLYQLVQEHLETFLAQVELETGAGFPEFVKDELMPFSHLPHCHGRGR